MSSLITPMDGASGIFQKFFLISMVVNTIIYLRLSCFSCYYWFFITV